MTVLCHAVVAAEEIPGHVELTQLEMLGATVEHVCETAMDQKTWESALASSGTRLNMRSHSDTHSREAHAGERSQVLPGDSPGPLSLDAVH